MSGVGWQQCGEREGARQEWPEMVLLLPHLPGCSEAPWFAPSQPLPFTTQGFSYQGQPQPGGCKQKSRPAVGTFLKHSPQRKDARVLSGSSESVVERELASEPNRGNSQAELEDLRSRFDKPCEEEPHTSCLQKCSYAGHRLSLIRENFGKWWFRECF